LMRTFWWNKNEFSAGRFFILRLYIVEAFRRFPLYNAWNCARPACACHPTSFKPLASGLGLLQLKDCNPLGWLVAAGGGDYCRD
jgi:hypothetical protein